MGKHDDSELSIAYLNAQRRIKELEDALREALHLCVVSEAAQDSDWDCSRKDCWKVLNLDGGGE